MCPERIWRMMMLDFEMVPLVLGIAGPIRISPLSFCLVMLKQCQHGGVAAANIFAVE